jgi:hypothetical protein
MKPDRLVLAFFAASLVAGNVFSVRADDGGSPLLSAPKVRVSAGQPDVQVGIKLKGRFKGSDVYSTKSSAKQRLSRKATSKTLTSLYRVQNDSRGLPGPSYSIFSVSGDGSDGNFAVAYFTEKGRNVTTSVLSGRYVLNIASDSEVVLRQKIAQARSNVPSRAKGVFAVKAENKRERLSDAAETVVTKP